jgi:hypothetical protein
MTKVHRALPAYLNQLEQMFFYSAVTDNQAYRAYRWPNHTFILHCENVHLWAGVA